MSLSKKTKTNPQRNSFGSLTLVKYSKLRRSIYFMLQSSAVPSWVRKAREALNRGYAVDLSGENINDISLLPKSTCLKYLDLSFVQLPDLNGAKLQKNIKTLIIDGSSISSFKGFSAFAGVTNVFMRDTPVSEIKNAVLSLLLVCPGVKNLNGRLISAATRRKYEDYPNKELAGKLVDRGWMAEYPMSYEQLERISENYNIVETDFSAFENKNKNVVDDFDDVWLNITKARRQMVKQARKNCGFLPAEDESSFASSAASSISLLPEGIGASSDLVEAIASILKDNDIEINEEDKENSVLMAVEDLCQKYDELFREDSIRSESVLSMSVGSENIRNYANDDAGSFHLSKLIAESSKEDLAKDSVVSASQKSERSGFRLSLSSDGTKDEEKDSEGDDVSTAANTEINRLSERVARLLRNSDDDSESGSFRAGSHDTDSVSTQSSLNIASLTAAKKPGQRITLNFDDSSTASPTRPSGSDRESTYEKSRRSNVLDSDGEREDRTRSSYLSAIKRDKSDSADEKDNRSRSSYLSAIKRDRSDSSEEKGNRSRSSYLSAIKRDKLDSAEEKDNRSRSSKSGSVRFDTTNIDIRRDVQAKPGNVGDFKAAPSGSLVDREGSNRSSYHYDSGYAGSHSESGNKAGYYSEPSYKNVHFDDRNKGEAKSGYDYDAGHTDTHDRSDAHSETRSSHRSDTGHSESYLKDDRRSEAKSDHLNNSKSYMSDSSHPRRNETSFDSGRGKKSEVSNNASNYDSRSNVTKSGNNNDTSRIGETYSGYGGDSDYKSSHRHDSETNSKSGKHHEGKSGSSHRSGHSRHEHSHSKGNKEGKTESDYDSKSSTSDHSHSTNSSQKKKGIFSFFSKDSKSDASKESSSKKDKKSSKEVDITAESKYSRSSPNSDRNSRDSRHSKDDRHSRSDHHDHSSRRDSDGHSKSSKKHSSELDTSRSSVSKSDVSKSSSRRHK